jgi:hypothetical protein
MAEGTLVVNIRDLEGALGGVSDLGSQFEAAATASGSISGGVDGVEGELAGQVSGLFEFDSAALIAQINELFGALELQAEVDPSPALAGFEQRIGAADQAIGGDLIGQLQTVIEAVEGIASGIPENRTEIFNVLVDQLLRVLTSLDGPEAETIRAWVQSVQDLSRNLLPLIDQAATVEDPQALVVQVFQQALDNVLDTLGYGSVKHLIDQLEAFLASLLPPSVVEPVANGLTLLSGSFSQTLSLAPADYPQFREAVVETSVAMQALRQDLRPLLGEINRLLDTPLFQPNALENYLRGQLDQALAVPIREAQRIEDPFNALFDRIDTAIESIDLSVVRDEVLGFFTTTRDTLEAVNLGGIGGTLQEALAPVEQVVGDLESGVGDLLGEIAEFFAGLVQLLRDLAGNVGEFLPNGQFEYRFEQDLRALFEQAEVAIAGDPTNPSAPSLAGTLAEFQSFLDGTLGQLSDLLTPLETAITDVTGDAVEGINQFTSFLTGLNIPALLEDLGAKVAEILDQLGPIDFALVIDPVVAEMESAAESLGQIDPEALNELLREALKVALDLVITIDLSGTITPPLRQGFAEIKQVPQAAIDALQAGYEEALTLLNALNPTQLLEVLFSAFDVVEAAIASLDLTALVKPLDDLHAQYLQAPLSSLQPSSLVEPLGAAFQSATASFAELDSAQIIAPLTQLLDRLKASVTGLDLTRWIDELLALVTQIQTGIQAIRPSQLLAPLSAEFARLETELDRVKPSVLFAPAVELAAPLVALIDDVQESVVDALHAMFQAPLALLDQLQPEALTAQIHGAIDRVLAALGRLNLPGRFNQLKAQHFDLQLAVQTPGAEAKLALVGNLDPEVELGELVALYTRLVGGLEALKQNLDLSRLGDLYVELREKLLGLLPPYARQLLDVETFKRVMRLADPTRFLTALDDRFEALKARLLPIRPEDIGAELDATYDTVVGLLDGLAIADSLAQVRSTIERLQDIVTTLRVDFLAADIDQALDQVRALVDGLDPMRMAAGLDTIYLRLLDVVAATLPSQLLAGLSALLDQVKGLVNSVNPRVLLEPPLLAAWAAIQAALGDIDLTVVLMPLIDKLDDLQGEFELSLGRTEDAFDTMLRAARNALSSGGASASVGVSL